MQVETHSSSIITSAPATVSVLTASSTAIVSANVKRKGLVISNSHATQGVWIAFGVAAVLNTGILIPARTSFVMSEYTYNIGAVNGIAEAGNTTVGVQEFTY